MLMNRARLIPRYNWDYGLSDLIKACSAAFTFNNSTGETLQEAFGLEPLYISSGRAALYTILKALELPEGAQVGVPLFCCPVVFDAVSQAGFVPRFIDITLDEYGISAADLDKKKGDLSALVVVHMFGHPANMNSLLSVCDGIPLVEDCAQSMFSKYQGEYTGFLSAASFFSFRSGKYISAGEGGAMFFRERSVRDAAQRIIPTGKNEGLLKDILHPTATYIKSSLYKRPWYGTVGLPLGTRLDRKLNLTAKSGFSVGSIRKSDVSIVEDRIRNFHKKIDRQRENSLYLLERVKVEGTFLPEERDGCWSNYYQFAIRFQNQDARDNMADYLFSQGIDAAKYLDEVLDVVTQDFDYQGDCPNAEHCSKTVLIIPNHYTLSRRDLDHIVRSVNAGASVLANS